MTDPLLSQRDNRYAERRQQSRLSVHCVAAVELAEINILLDVRYYLLPRHLESGDINTDTNPSFTVLTIVDNWPEFLFVTF